MSNAIQTSTERNVVDLAAVNNPLLDTIGPDDDFRFGSQIGQGKPAGVHTHAAGRSAYRAMANASFEDAFPVFTAGMSMPPFRGITLA